MAETNQTFQKRLQHHRGHRRLLQHEDQQRQPDRRQKHRYSVSDPEFFGSWEIRCHQVWSNGANRPEFTGNY